MNDYKFSYKLDTPFVKKAEKNGKHKDQTLYRWVQEDDAGYDLEIYFHSGIYDPFRGFQKISGVMSTHQYDAIIRKLDHAGVEYLTGEELEKAKKGEDIDLGGRQ